MIQTSAARSDPEFLAAVHQGLSATPRTLPCRYFYDLEGSRLFDQICELPEYYLTRAEDALLRDHADEIAGSVLPGTELVELGSGSATKTRRLISALLRRQPELRYYPVDISGEMLRETAGALTGEYPRLSVVPVVGEYGPAMQRLSGERNGPRLVLFLGSNLGNFTESAALDFLRRVRAMTALGDFVLLGLDLLKDLAVLHAAYDDPRGVTACFNLNILRRINTELGADFDLQGWRHEARYNPERGCMEMHLVCIPGQTVRLDGGVYHFAPGESIHTEDSHKYTPGQIREMAGESGFRLVRSWQDAGRLFSLSLLAPES